MRKQSVIDAMDEMLNINDDMSVGEVKKIHENYDLVLAQLNHAVEEYAAEKYLENHDDYSRIYFTELEKLVVDAKFSVSFYVNFYNRREGYNDSRKVDDILVDLQDVFNDEDSHFVPKENIEKELFESMRQWDRINSYHTSDIDINTLEEVSKYLVANGIVKKNSVPYDKDTAIQHTSQVIQNVAEEHHPDVRVFKHEKDIRRKEDADALAQYLYYEKLLA